MGSDGIVQPPPLLDEYGGLGLDAVAALEGCVQAGDRLWGVQEPKMRCRTAYSEQVRLEQPTAQLSWPVERSRIGGAPGPASYLPHRVLAAVELPGIYTCTVALRPV